MREAIVQGLAAFLLGMVTLALSAPSRNAEDFVVRVQKAGPGLDVYAELTVAAAAEEIWGVLTDYDQMAQILSSVDASRVIKREGHRLEVAQTSHIGFGPFKLTLNNLRRIELVPKREIRSHLIQGDLKASDFTTRLVKEGAVMRVVWRGRIVPGPLARLAVTADAVEVEVRQLCRELRGEILRRKAGRSAPPCHTGKTCD